METGPLATTSANISGQSPVKDALEASIQFPGIPILMASTVIEWNEGEWKLIRAGSVVLKKNKK